MPNPDLTELHPCQLFPGLYDLPEATVLSIPVTFTGGEWSALLDVNIEDELKQRLRLFAGELRQVRPVSK